MPVPLRFFAPLNLEIEIRERARKSGRTTSDEVLRIVWAGMGAQPPVALPEAVVDRAELGGKGNQVVAAYLSKPLSSAIKRLAQEQSRSASHVMRSLIREALHARGILPAPATDTTEAAD
jgi:hypothetical protein